MPHGTIVANTGASAKCGVSVRAVWWMAERRQLPVVSLIRRRPRRRKPVVAGPETAPADREVRPRRQRRLLRRASAQCSPHHAGRRPSHALREQPDGMAWIGLYRPDATELNSLAAEFDLHELAVEDAIHAHQRPKLERYGDTLFVVLRAARYLDDVEEVEFGELHIFIGRDFVDHRPARRVARPRPSCGTRLEDDPELLALRHRGGALRDPRRRRRRLPAGRRRHRERRRRDRDAGLRRRPRGVAAHLRAVPRGRRLPARRVAAGRDARRRSPPASTSTTSTRSCAARCATSPTTSPR